MTVPRLLSLVVTLGCTIQALPASAAEAVESPADQIRRELQQLRDEYEARFRALEDKLRQLEAPASPATPPAPATPPPATAPAPGADHPTADARPVPPPATSPADATVGREFAEREFQRATESRDRSMLLENRPVRERVEEILQDFVEIRGYFRAGYGRNDEGGSQVGFRAPGAFAKYRLGNEAENYGELTFGKNFYLPGMFSLEPDRPSDQVPDGPVARVQTTLSVFNPYEELLASGSTDFGLPEAWASIGNVVPSLPSMKFWAGSRFYRRHDIHINDFYFFNMSGTGGGVEDVPLPFGRAAFAWIGAASTSGFSDLPEPDASNRAGFSKGNFDLRLYDVVVPGGTAEAALVYARANSGLDASGRTAPDADGVAATVLHTASPFLGPTGVNKFSLQFGTGAARTFTSGFETMALPQGLFIRPEDPDAWRFRVTEHFTTDLSDSFSIGPAFVYQLTDEADSGGRAHWLSVGVRPVFRFGRYVSLALEGGWDWVDDQGSGPSGHLYKLTLAPQVSLGNLFMSRPVLRAFLTHAGWTDGFRGQVGGNDYVSETTGLVYGLQMEAWW